MTTVTELTFVDSNVLVYAHDSDAGERHEQAIGVVEDLWTHGNGALSTQVMQEFYVTATRKLTRPLARQEAREILSEYSTWRVHRTSPPDVVDASLLEEQHTLQFWDALIVTAAGRLGAAVLLSEDLQHGRTFGALTIRNPFRTEGQGSG